MSPYLHPKHFLKGLTMTAITKTLIGVGTVVTLLVTLMAFSGCGKKKTLQEEKDAFKDEVIKSLKEENSSLKSSVKTLTDDKTKLEVEKQVRAARDEEQKKAQDAQKDAAKQVAAEKAKVEADQKRIDEEKRKLKEREEEVEKKLKTSLQYLREKKEASLVEMREKNEEELGKKNDELVLLNYSGPPSKRHEKRAEIIALQRKIRETEKNAEKQFDVRIAQLETMVKKNLLGDIAFK